MNKKINISLRFRLSILFSLISAILFAIMGVYAYSALSREISYRDDSALMGRVDRIKSILHDGKNIDFLRNQPEIYENMLGNKENFLWILDDSGKLLIEVNPEKLPMPSIGTLHPPMLFTTTVSGSARMAWLKVSGSNGAFFVIAGKLLSEREHMLNAYRRDLGLGWLVGVLLTFFVSWEAVRRGLKPLLKLSLQAASIGPQELRLRLDESSQPKELQAMTAALNLMLQRLEDGYLKLSQFSEDLAHEMRTPLNTLILQNQVALSKAPTIEDYEKYIDSQQEEFERLSRMIDNMLFLARAEQLDDLIEIETVDLENTSKQLLGYFEGMAQERGMRIEAIAQGFIQADTRLVRRALANLLANAIRYGDENTVISLSSNFIAHKWMEIEVFNQVPKIDEHHLPRIFDRFYRCDVSRSRTDDSGGLGLAIVKSIMHMHHGEVLVSSTSEGTRFTLRFPVESLNAQESH
ncbi:MAG: heavy metal sensor histidine kinase [Comamonas sp.]